MIRSNLKSVIDNYRSEHPGHKLTMTELSRETGISRHALNTLCGKTKSPKGITFDTLNRLIEFFDLPVNKFLKYIPNNIKITLIDADKAVSLKRIISKLSLSLKPLISGSIFMTVDIGNIHTTLLLSADKLKSNVFGISLNVIFSNSMPQFQAMFNSLNDTFMSYIYDRILAHSGKLTVRSANHADNLLINVLLNKPTNRNSLNWEFRRGLPTEFIRNRRPEFKDEYSGLVIIDKTTNQFRTS